MLIWTFILEVLNFHCEAILLMRPEIIEMRDRWQDQKRKKPCCLKQNSPENFGEAEREWCCEDWKLEDKRLAGEDEGQKLRERQKGQRKGENGGIYALLGTRFTQNLWRKARWNNEGEFWDWTFGITQGAKLPSGNNNSIQLGVNLGTLGAVFERKIHTF